MAEVEASFTRTCQSQQRRKRTGNVVQKKHFSKDIFTVVNDVSNPEKYDKILLEAFLNPQKIAETEETKKAFVKMTQQFYNNSDMAASYPNLFKLLWYSNIPCFENPVTDSYLIKKCFWQGDEIACSEVFQQVPTDSGKYLNIRELILERNKIIINTRDVLCLQC